MIPRPMPPQARPVRPAPVRPGHASARRTGGESRFRRPSVLAERPNDAKPSHPIRGVDRGSLQDCEKTGPVHEPGARRRSWSVRSAKKPARRRAWKDGIEVRGNRITAQRRWRAQWLGLALGVVGTQSSAWAQEVAASFPPAWATRGEDLQLSIRVDDPLRVVRSVRYFVTLDGSEVRTATASIDTEFRTILPAEELWRTSPETLTLRAELLGRRGGLISTLGEPVPLRIDILTPLASDRRRAALKAPTRRGSSPVSASVGLVGQLGVSARARAALRIGWTLGRWEPGLIASVGPNSQREDGDLTFGGELEFRRYVPLGPEPPWTPYAAVRAGLDGRFPGLDPLGGTAVGVQFPLGDVALELQADGTVLYVDRGHEGDAAFSGGLRVWLRFTGPRDRAGPAGPDARGGV
jgi:hypothetical protein